MSRKNTDIVFKSFTPHTLKHTFVSNCNANGMNPKTLQKIMGHSTLQITMDLYRHVLDETKRLKKKWRWFLNEKLQQFVPTKKQFVHKPYFFKGK
ncbi:MAG: tyrosine-type recombinase/integrase [Lachnospiraceae bacterium]|nr:tyrosine-type recombinase/integrase [Lachnospiraceae bacterium]